MERLEFVSCGRCRFWIRSEGDSGVCRRNAPSPAFCVQGSVLKTLKTRHISSNKFEKGYTTISNNTIVIISPQTSAEWGCFQGEPNELTS